MYSISIVIDRTKNVCVNIFDFGNFPGDVDAACEAIQAFADKAENTISSKSHGGGYGEIIVNGKKHNYTPYGIDVPMMLKFCGLDANEFQTSSSMSFR